MAKRIGSGNIYNFVAYIGDEANFRKIPRKIRCAEAHRDRFFRRIDKPTVPSDRLFRESFVLIFFWRVTILGVKTDAEPVEIDSISREIYVSAIDLAALLKITDNEVSRLSRSGVLARVPHPADGRAFLIRSCRTLPLT